MFSSQGSFPRSRHEIISPHPPKSGDTPGWNVTANDDIALVECPQSKTDATLTVPINGLQVGDYITGFHLVGQIGTSGNTVAISCNLRKHTAGVSAISDTSILIGPTVISTLSTILGISNTLSSVISQQVNNGDSYYYLITATTGIGSSINLQYVHTIITEV